MLDFNFLFSLWKIIQESNSFMYTRCIARGCEALKPDKSRVIEVYGWFRASSYRLRRLCFPSNSMQSNVFQYAVLHFKKIMQYNVVIYHTDSLKSGNITGQYQMSPEISRKNGTFDND